MNTYQKGNRVDNLICAVWLECIYSLEQPDDIRLYWLLKKHLIWTRMEKIINDESFIKFKKDEEIKYYSWEE